MKSGGDGASSAGSNGDRNGGVLRRSQAGSFLSLRCELGKAKVSNGCEEERGIERSRRCGSARSYSGGNDRRTPTHYEHFLNNFDAIGHSNSNKTIK